MFLEQSNVEKTDAEQGKIVVRLLDKGFFKDMLIGQFEFDLSHIYFMKDHRMLHQWIALSNPEEEDEKAITEISGYLKLSIAVSCTGDDQIQMPDEDENEQNDNVLMPPQLNPKYY